MDPYIRKGIITNIVDGDTVDALVDLGYHVTTTQRFRLLGVDTPERNQEGYQEATDYIKEKILLEKVYIRSVKSDSFGRFLAEIYLQDEKISINQQLLDNGYAKVFEK